MSNVDAPDVSSGETNNPDLLAEQSGMPNMSSTKTFTVDTNMQVNGDLDVTGTVTATSFVGDGSQLTGISGGTGGGGLDSAAVTLLVDSDYVQARETPQDFAYSSLTGAPTALSSFTNDTSYITAADIPATVDSDYVAARSPVGGGLDSAEVQLLIDADLMGTPDGTVQIGDGSNAGQLYSTAIGYNASTTGFYTIAIGENASAQGGETVSIGRGTVNSGLNSVALGTGANIGAHYSVALGDNAEIDGANSIAIGRNSVAGAYAQENGTAIGEGAEARAANTIVISSTGVTNTVTSQYDIDIRTSAAGSLTYNTTNDWTFGAGVTMTDLTASGATVVFSNLPTIDPVNAGQLWNDNGTLKVSAG